MHGNGSDDGASDTGDVPEESVARVRHLLEASNRAHEDAERARRLASTQTQADIVTELKSYADQLERQAFLFDQQAAEFARKLGVTHRLSEEIKQLSDKAHATLREMADRLERPK